jgi:hypothetical protein
MWAWFGHRVDLQTAQKTLIYEDDDPGFRFVDVRTHVSGHGKDSPLYLRCRTRCLGCDFKVDGRTPAIASSDDLGIRNLGPKGSSPREVLTQQEIQHLLLCSTQCSALSAIMNHIVPPRRLGCPHTPECVPLCGTMGAPSG